MASHGPPPWREYGVSDHRAETAWRTPGRRVPASAVRGEDPLSKWGDYTIHATEQKHAVGPAAARALGNRSHRSALGPQDAGMVSGIYVPWAITSTQKTPERPPDPGRMTQALTKQKRPSHPPDHPVIGSGAGRYSTLAQALVDIHEAFFSAVPTPDRQVPCSRLWPYSLLCGSTADGANNFPIHCYYFTIPFSCLQHFLPPFIQYYQKIYTASRPNSGDCYSFFRRFLGRRYLHSLLGIGSKYLR